MRTTRNLLLIAGILLAAPLYAPAHAQDSAPATPPAAVLAVQERLFNVDETQGTEAALTEVGKMVGRQDINPDELMGSTRFLSERDARASDPRYGLSLSIVEAKLANTFGRMEGDEKKKQGFSFHFQSITRYLGNSLVLRQDIARCADKTAGQAALRAWQGPTAGMVDAYRKFPQEVKEKVREGLNLYQMKKAGRPPLAWVCRDGMDAIKIATEKGLTETVQTNVGGVKGTDTRATAAVDPYLTFIDDSAWALRRKEIYDELLTTLDKPTQ